MSTLIFEIEAISDLALEVMKAVIDKNEQTNKFEDPDSGPLAVASALSDFFQIASALGQGHASLDADEMAEFADYGLDLLDRLAFQLLALEVMEHRENMARIFISIGVWFSRQDATLDNLEGIADGFGRLTNGLNDPKELAEMCQLMAEVADAASNKLQLDEDQSNPYRPWRVLNLNAGIAATRSLDPQLMEQTFDELVRRLPTDMPGFLADGKRQMITQNVPDEVREVMDRYAEKWPAALPH
ncbi:MAG: hypothetical protein QNJ69_07845 [Gammaproteobacteria bacterium]|nr:hypothetical protein [Gammaproteobacteria bacterium]